MPKVSVIVPIYNVEKYLHRCIHSILAQSFSDFELILVDDGSTDQCSDICDEYLEKDRRVRVIHQINSKISAARNAGMEIAEGEWISFIDSDDWVHEDYLRLLMNGVQEDTDVVICQCLQTENEPDQDLEYSNILYKNITLKEIEGKPIIRSRVWGRVYRKSALQGQQFISGSEPAEDICFNELFYHNGLKFRFTDAALYYYYQRPDSAAHSHFGRGALNAVRVWIRALEQIDDPEKRVRILSRCYKFVLSSRYGEMFTDDYCEVCKQCRMLLKTLSKHNRELNWKERIIFFIFSRSPGLYRIWRIHNDPTLRKFEGDKRMQNGSRKGFGKDL